MNRSSWFTITKHNNYIQRIFFRIFFLFHEKLYEKTQVSRVNNEQSFATTLGDGDPEEVPDGRIRSVWRIQEAKDGYNGRYRREAIADSMS